MLCTTISLTPKTGRGWGYIEMDMLTVFLYIDPGTGSMLFTILIGVLGTAAYLLRNVWLRLRFAFTGGAKEKKQDERLPIAVFSDSKRYWNLFEPICDEFEKRGEKLEYMTASPDDPALKKHYEHVVCRFIGEGNRAFAHLNLLKADVLLSTTPGLDVYQLVDYCHSLGLKICFRAVDTQEDLERSLALGIDYLPTNNLW